MSSVECPVHGATLNTDGTCTISSAYHVCFYTKPAADHILVVSPEIDPETGQREYEIEHPNCPTEEVFDGFSQYSCGYDNLVGEGLAEGDEAWETPGRYLMQMCPWKSWTDYGWEHDGQLYLMPEQEPSEAR